MLALCLCFAWQPAARKKEKSKVETRIRGVNSPGKVTVYMPSPAGLADKLAAAFCVRRRVWRRTVSGNNGEILARLEAEQANPMRMSSFLLLASDGLTLKADGQLASYTPADVDKINKGWIDSDNTLFGYSASAVAVIYNTTLVPELSADWKDLADTQYKDMIAILILKIGACKDFLAGFVTGLDDGEEIIESWAETVWSCPVQIRRHWAVTTGEGILTRRRRLQRYSSMQKGEPLNIYYPASGTVVNPVRPLFSRQLRTWIMPKRLSISCSVMKRKRWLQKPTSCPAVVMSNVKAVVILMKFRRFPPIGTI